MEVDWKEKSQKMISLNIGILKILQKQLYKLNSAQHPSKKILLLDLVWWRFSKAKAEVEQRKKEVQENPFIVKPRNGRKGKKFGEKLNKKTSEPTILTLKESIEKNIDNESKIRNKRQVI